MSAFRLWCLTRALTAARNWADSGHVSLKVKYGAKMSFDHADISCVEEEN